jgi:hypothetical protein
VKLLVRLAKQAGLSGVEVHWHDHLPPKALGLRVLPLRLGKVTAGSWVFQAVRNVVP